MTQAVIRLAGVDKRFDDVVALNQVSIDFSEGEFFALLGPSGCGKTTLLRILAGFEHPDRGQVYLDGKDITALRALHRPVNMMFQSYALFPHMSVESNISYGLEMEGKPKQEISRRVGEMLAMVQLDSLRTRKPRQLSGGQQQRVALARALIKRPRVLLLDEPLGALDKKLRSEMQLELKRLQHELGITFIVVTHDQEEALVMADQIALMQHGSISQVGAPRDVYEFPNSRYVADFIGVSNFIDGRLSAKGVEVRDHGTLAIADSAAFSAGDKVTVAVRPERLALSVASPMPEHNALAGVVANIAYHGQDLTVHVNVAGVAKTLAVRVAANQLDAAPWKIGDNVWCNWRATDARLLAVEKA